NAHASFNRSENQNSRRHGWCNHWKTVESRGLGGFNPSKNQNRRGLGWFNRSENGDNRGIGWFNHPENPNIDPSWPHPSPQNAKPQVKRGDTEGRSEEHTSELQSRFDIVCRLLLEKKKTKRP